MTNGQLPPWMKQQQQRSPQRPVPQQGQYQQQPQQRPMPQQPQQRPPMQPPGIGPPGMQQPPGVPPRPGFQQGKLPSVKKKKALRILVALLAISGLAVIVSAIFFFLNYV